VLGWMACHFSLGGALVEAVELLLPLEFSPPLADLSPLCTSGLDLLNFLAHTLFCHPPWRFFIDKSTTLGPDYFPNLTSSSPCILTNAYLTFYEPPLRLAAAPYKSVKKIPVIYPSPVPSLESGS